MRESPCSGRRQPTRPLRVPTISMRAYARLPNKRKKNGPNDGRRERGIKRPSELKLRRLLLLPQRWLAMAVGTSRWTRWLRWDLPLLDLLRAVGDEAQGHYPDALYSLRPALILYLYPSTSNQSLIPDPSKTRPSLIPQKQDPSRTSDTNLCIRSGKRWHPSIIIRSLDYRRIIFCV